MGEAAVTAAFLLQPHPLLHTEAVLLIDNDECEIGKLHAGLKQRMGTHDDTDRAAGDSLKGRPSRARRL